MILDYLIPESFDLNEEPKIVVEKSLQGLKKEYDFKISEKDMNNLVIFVEELQENAKQFVTDYISSGLFPLESLEE